MPAQRRTPIDHQAPASFVEIKTGSTERHDEVLFAIDGERYSITVPVAAGITLQAMDKMTESSEAAAMMWLLKELIGAAGYRALSTHPDVTAEHLKGILDRLQEVTLGEMEDLGKG